MGRDVALVSGAAGYPCPLRLLSPPLSFSLLSFPLCLSCLKDTCVVAAFPSPPLLLPSSLSPPFPTARASFLRANELVPGMQLVQDNLKALQEHLDYREEQLAKQARTEHADL